jgi:pyridoxine 4-dehydrogenase
LEDIALTSSTTTRRQLLLEAGAAATALSFCSPLRLALASEATAVAKARDARPAAAAGVVAIGALTVIRRGCGALRSTGEPGFWGEPKDLRAIQKLLHRVVRLGVNFIDTADAYGPGVSERLLYETLHPYPKDLVIATKGGFVHSSRDIYESDGSPQHLRDACEASLKRLHLERIDLYQLHVIDPRVPVEESMGELARLQQEGKIRHVGVSNFGLEDLRKARQIVKVVSVQNAYNVRNRDSEAVLNYCAANEIAFLPWAPLARPDENVTEPPAVLQALQNIADNRHKSTAQVALAWLLARSPVILPIPGTSSTQHLEENVAAASIKLTPEELTLLG